MISKPTHPLHRRPLHVRTDERSQTATGEIARDVPQHLGQIGPSATARVEHVDVLVRQPVGYAEIVPERPVHMRHHVAHDFRRCVPDAELLPQFRIEGFEERLVEVRHGLASLKRAKKQGDPPG